MANGLMGLVNPLEKSVNKYFLIFHAAATPQNTKSQKVSKFSAKRSNKFKLILYLLPLLIQSNLEENFEFGTFCSFFENNFVYLDREETITELIMFWNKRKTENLADTLFTKYYYQFVV